MFLSAIFKLQPTRSQHRALETALEQTRLLYNAALEERISAYRRGVRIRRFDQTRSLTEIRGLDELGWSRYPVALGRWPLRQLDEAYKAAFKRGQNGQPWSFPRFRSKARFRSFGLLSWSGARIEAGRIVIKGLGALRLHLHRAAPENGDILGCTLTKRGRGWTVQLQIRTSPQASSSPFWTTRPDGPAGASSASIPMGRLRRAPPAANGFPRPSPSASTAVPAGSTRTATRTPPATATAAPTTSTRRWS